MSILELLEPRSGAVGTSPAPDRGTARPSIAVVPDLPARPSRVPFVLLVLLVLGVGLVGLLLLNTNLQQGSFTIHDLERRTAELEKRQGELEQKVAAAQAPENLASRARQQGMVPNSAPGFLELSNGSVAGDPKPAQPRKPAQKQPDPRSAEAAQQPGRQGESARAPEQRTGQPGSQPGNQPGNQRANQPGQQPNPQPNRPNQQAGTGR